MSQENENVISAEQLAEMDAQKNQTLYGKNVKKINGCAVVELEGEVVSLELPITYPQLASALINKKFDADKASAATANYLSAKEIISTNGIDDDVKAKAEEHISEYEAYQAWRTLAKATAKEIIFG